ncbi:MAG: hypothetical protein ABIH78_01210 [Candidatus Peregrinibacteria bacterium]
MEKPNPEKFIPKGEAPKAFDASEIAKRRGEQFGPAEELLEEAPSFTAVRYFESGSVKPPKEKIPPSKEGKIRTYTGSADGKAVNLYAKRENDVAYEEKGEKVKWYKAMQKDADLLCQLMAEGSVDIKGAKKGSRKFNRLQEVLTTIASQNGGKVETDREWAKMLVDLRSNGFSYDELSAYDGPLNVLIAFQRALSGEREKGITLKDFSGQNPRLKTISLVASKAEGEKYRALYVLDEDASQPLVAQNAEK